MRAPRLQLAPPPIRKPELLVEPRSLKERYLEEVGNFQTALKKGCRNLDADYVLMNTGQPLDVALSAYLATSFTSRASMTSVTMRNPVSSRA